MFNSNVLEVGVGLIFTFLAVSLITGAIVETITSAVGWRANTLLNGIKALLNDPNFTGLARELYNHASISPRSPGVVNSSATATSSGVQSNPRTIQRVWLAFQHIRQIKEKPSYVSKEQFANALMDITGMSAAIATAAGTPGGLAGALTTAINKKVAPASTTTGTSITPSGSTPDAQIHQLLTGMVERNLGDAGKIKSDLENWFDTAMDRLSGVYKR
jgi:hypothetical protein